MKILQIAIVLISCCAASVMGQTPKYPQPILAPEAHVFGYAFDRDDKQMVINYIFQEAQEFDERYGLAIVKFNGHYGVINPGGSFVIDPIYEDIILNPDYGTYTVRLNSKCGVVNRGGDIIHAIKYDNIGATTDGWYEGELDGTWLYFAPDGRVTDSMSKYLEWKRPRPQ